MIKQFNPTTMDLTRYIFFTGKGGVGKTSAACATAVTLADQGKKVLIVSTDPASNLDDVFETELSSKPGPITGITGLDGANLDPEEAAEKYREKVVGPYRGVLPDAAVAGIEEQLSGACTLEIAAFDEFAGLLSDPELTKAYDHVIFDTAPTGHTLRLLQLPKAWDSFLDQNTTGSTCIGPLSGLGNKKELYANTVKALANASLTTLILVTRPELGALTEADRTSAELKELSINNQLLLVNGLFTSESQDSFAKALQNRQKEALNNLPRSLSNLPQYAVSLAPYNITGIEHLRSMFSGSSNDLPQDHQPLQILPTKGLDQLTDHLASKGKGIVLTMGKGGVGKTTMAASLAVALAEKDIPVHLTTTDPAAHLDQTIGSIEGRKQLKVSRIDPRVETERYKQEVIEQVGPTLDQDGLALLKEDLASPCTEEIAVFKAFARIVQEANEKVIIFDTAPTGHTLLLLDAAQSYHRQVEKASGQADQSVKDLLPTLRDPQQTDVVLVTLPEATPVIEASRLQDDLVRAGITPSWWIINQSWAALDTSDSILKGRAQSEVPWINKVSSELAENTALIGWQINEPVGWDNLKSLAVA